MTNTRPATSGRSRLGWVLGLTSTAYFMVVLDSSVVLTALPRMQHDLHASLASLQWTVNAYGIAFAAGIITAAALGDRFGRRRIFNAGLALFTLASAACALAPETAALIAARTVQGLGAAAVMPLSLTILTAAFPCAGAGSSSASTAAWPGWPSRPGHWSVARSPRDSTGTGSSGSTSRSA